MKRVGIDFLHTSVLSIRNLSEENSHFHHSLKLETDPKTSLALLSAPGLKYRVQQKNSSNKILILNPTTTRSSIPNTTLDTEEPAVTIISKIEDTLELLEYKEEDVKEKKVNKWHEKFAKGRKK